MMARQIIAVLSLLAVIGALLAVAVYSQAAMYVSIVAIGLAVALQKYVASYFGYFVISFSHIFSRGDRIRIGNLKGDVKRIGLLHFTLDEVGEDEKLGGELTGRILHVPNLIVLDQPVLNYSKSYSVEEKVMACDYIFDEIRIPLSSQSPVPEAIQILEEILKKEDQEPLERARALFQGRYPAFLQEAESEPRVLLHIEPQKIWLKGKFVTSFKTRNELRSKMYLEFIQQAANHPGIRLA